ncbi:MFS family permease [Arthrobacter sp. PvP023]|uniref:MFS transporter n=1 Tax=Micrococcaceae TaxID=1268 RepID=UPI001AEB929F|nr:MFS transporter [Arthrobacter sp. PvP023]MBP1134392.1 MFS family permease [Arthrobacter sp. PvP023]
MFAVLRNGVYARLFCAQIVALAGTGLLTIALGLLAYDLAGRNSGAVLGTALTIKMLAYVGLAPVITALVARLPRKPVLIAADLVRAAMALCLPFITETWQIYVVIFLLQSASATFTPAFQSLIPIILKDPRDYTYALSLSRLAYDMEALVSPAAAALLLTVMSYSNLFLGTVAGFVASATLVAMTAVPRITAPGGPQPSLWHRTTLGTRIFWRDRRLRSLLALNLAVSAPTALVLVNTVVYVRDGLHRPASDLAVALACFGAGSMAVALAAPRLLDRFGDRAVMMTGASLIPPSLAGAAAVMFLASPETGWWPLLALWLLLGAATSAVITPSSRLLREASTASTLPYVFTAQFSLSHACYILSYPLAGWIGAAAGLGWAAVALTILAILGSAGAFLFWPGKTPLGPDPAAIKEQTVEQPAEQSVQRRN